MKKSFVALIFLISSNVNAYDFENTTCFIISNGEIQTISSIQIEKAMTLKNASDMPSHWTQKSESLEFVNVKFTYTSGPGSEATYRIINGALHETFKGNDGVKIFRKITPKFLPERGYREQVGINGSRLEYNLVSPIECQKSIF